MTNVRQTIRKLRKRPIKPGDKLVLATWEGAPYRSKVRRLRESVCTYVSPIVIGAFVNHDEIEVNGLMLDTSARARLSRDDGFECTSEMLDWFKENHSLPFEGVVIRWS
jgi:hypothetical protein